MNKKMLKIIQKAVKDITIANNGEPLDGDETQEICKVFGGELDYNNGNI